MPKLLAAGTWFEPVSARSLYETDYENAILRHAADLFPDFYCVNFKTLVESDYGNAKADLALVDRRYRSWTVVEVELDTHPLQDHVVEQISKLARGTYTSKHAEALFKENADLDLDSLNEMMLGDQPEILVLVTSHKPTWAPALAQYGAKVGVIEMFRSDTNSVILRVSGDHPSGISEEVIATCRVDSLLPNGLRILTAAPFVGLDIVSLDYEGYSSDWRIIRTASDSWMTAAGRYPLNSEAKKFQIIDQGSNNFAIREAIN